MRLPRLSSADLGGRRLLPNIVGGSEANNQVEARIVTQDFPDRPRDVSATHEPGKRPPPG